MPGKQGRWSPLDLVMRQAGPSAGPEAYGRAPRHTSCGGGRGQVGQAAASFGLRSPSAIPLESSGMALIHRAAAQALLAEMILETAATCSPCSRAHDAPVASAQVSSEQGLCLNRRGGKGLPGIAEEEWECGTAFADGQAASATEHRGTCAQLLMQGGLNRGHAWSNESCASSDSAFSSAGSEAQQTPGTLLEEGGEGGERRLVQRERALKSEQRTALPSAATQSTVNANLSHSWHHNAGLQKDSAVTCCREDITVSQHGDCSRDSLALAGTSIPPLLLRDDLKQGAGISSISLTLLGKDHHQAACIPRLRPGAHVPRGFIADGSGRLMREITTLDVGAQPGSRWHKIAKSMRKRVAEAGGEGLGMELEMAHGELDGSQDQRGQERHNPVLRAQQTGRVHCATAHDELKAFARLSSVIEGSFVRAKGALVGAGLCVL